MPEIVVVGHASIDHIRNTNGERVQPGGAAIYAAMGAKTVCKDIGVVTAVGSDYKYWDQISDFPPELIKRVNQKSTQFFIKYDSDWNAHYRRINIGPGSRVMTDDVLKVINQGVRMIHLAPMNPPKVLKMVKAIRDQKLDVKICVNSCIHYLGGNSNRKAVMEAASLSDIFILNEKELHALTGKEMVSEAVDALKTDTLVLTLGEIGTIVRSSGRSEFVPAMAAITKNAVDVTGAGDTWSGTFLSSLHKSGSWIRAVSFASVVSAIKCTGWNFERIQKLSFEDVEDVYTLPVALKEKGRQLTLSDSLRAIAKAKR